MSDFVWHVETTGGTAKSVKGAIERAVGRLQSGDAPGLEPDEVDP